MARLHVLSDLHLEHGEFVPARVDADVTILAGDTYTRRRCCTWPDAQAAFGHPVLAIAGNHEFYGKAIDTVTLGTRQSAADRNVTWLDNQVTVVAGCRILGSTLWTDFRFFSGDDMERTRRDASAAVGDRQRNRVNDFWDIRVAREGYRRFRPKDAAMLHMASVRWLGQELSTPFDGPTVVVTHHAPSARCVPAELLDDRRICAYASRLDWLIERHQPDLWIWGHIHGSVPDFRIGRTRMVSNPRGYAPDDINPGFRPGLVVEV